MGEESFVEELDEEVAGAAADGVDGGGVSAEVGDGACDVEAAAAGVVFGCGAAEFGVVGDVGCGAALVDGWVHGEGDDFVNWDSPS